jgi:hypothetical protein
VPLENVLEPELLLSTIGYALGIRETPACSWRSAWRSRSTSVGCCSCSTTSSRSSARRRSSCQLYTIAPDAQFLVTSRVVLRIRGERVYEVGPLRDTRSCDRPTRSRGRGLHRPSSCSRSARAPANPAFELTDDEPASVVGICQRARRGPLALELAAARTRVLTPADILRRLDRQLTLLVDSSRDVPERQRTLRATIAWSVGLLDEPSRRSSRSSPCSRPGSSSIRWKRSRGCGNRTSTCSERWRRSWTRHSSIGTKAMASLVFSLLVSVREYGVELLAAAGQEDAVRDAHAARLHRRRAHAGGASRYE